MDQLVEALKKLLETLTEHPGGVWVFAGLILLIGLKGLLRVMGNGFGNAAAPGPADFPYERAEFLSAAERSFLGALDLAVGARFRIFAKVRLADVITTRARLGGRRRHAAFNSISAKHVDFVLCDPATMAVALVVELDDASHRSASQREKDEWKDAALKVAGIPVLRVPAARSYVAAGLVEAVEGMVGAGRA